MVHDEGCGRRDTKGRLDKQRWKHMRVRSTPRTFSKFRLNWELARSLHVRGRDGLPGSHRLLACARGWGDDGAANATAVLQKMVLPCTASPENSGITCFLDDPQRPKCSEARLRRWGLQWTDTCRYWRGT